MLPFQLHPTTQILDSTKLKAFRCPRKFFYTYVLGWKPDFPSNDLIFGESVHKAFDSIYNSNSLASESLVEGFNAFLRCYRKAFDEGTDGLFKAKCPDAAFEMIGKYANEYQDDLQNYKTIATEISGSVPVSLTPDRRLHFRLDRVSQDLRDGKIVNFEIKTTSLNLSDVWQWQWELDNQIGVYTHALYCFYPREQVKGAIVDGVSFRQLKSGFSINFKRVPIQKSDAQMQFWLWEINDLIDRVEWEYQRLDSCSENDPVLQCFPRDPTV